MRDIRVQAGSGLTTMAASALLVALLSGRVFAERLSDVLQTHGITAAQEELRNLDKPITSYATLDDGHVFVIGYYLDDGSRILTPPLFVSLFDRIAHQWKNTEIPQDTSRFEDIHCLGSVTEIHSSNRAFYVGTHLTPSAGCTIVLSKELAVQKVFYGWFLAAFGDGSVVYHNSQRHFAPTHYAELLIYNPRDGKDVKIYPMKPYQRIRNDHINKVRGVYSDEAWCNKHNHHCDPELFDNHLRSEVVVSDVTNALAFVVAFDNTVYWSEQERWRLEGFRELRKYLSENPVGTSLPDDLFMDLYEDLARIHTLKAQEHIVGLFEKDQEIHDLLKAALAANRHAGQPWREFFAELDSRWERLEIWKRLAQAIESPPEFTEVVYIYRHINTPQPIEYKEVLLTDLRARFGDIPIQRLLDPEILEKVFAP